MMGRTFCPLGDAAAMPTLGFVKKFRKSSRYIEGKYLDRQAAVPQPTPSSRSNRVGATRTRRSLDVAP